MAIPKHLHICWFGHGEPSAKIEWTIETIRKLERRGYRLSIWTESNYDVGKSEVMKWAYDNKKWSLVSNYARLDVLKDHGGIYLDTDVEVVRPFDELLLHDFFIGFMWDSTLGTAVIGAVPNQRYISDILDGYNTCPETFISPNNNTFTEYFLRNVSGFRLNGRKQRIGNSIVLDKFALENPSYLRRRNYTVHHFEQSWKQTNRLKAITKEMTINFFSLWLYRKYVCWNSLRKSPYYGDYQQALRGECND